MYYVTCSSDLCGVSDLFVMLCYMCCQSASGLVALYCCNVLCYVPVTCHSVCRYVIDCYDVTCLKPCKYVLFVLYLPLSFQEVRK